MSKLRKPIFIFAFVFALTLQFFTESAAQTIETRIKFESISPATLKIEGKFLLTKKKETSRLQHLMPESKILAHESTT